MDYTIWAYILISTLVVVFFYNYLQTSKQGATSANGSFYLSPPVSIALKGIAAVIIICHHYCLYRFNYVEHNLFTSLIPRNGGNFALVIFLFLSGYGVTKSEMTRPNTPKQFLRRRIWKVLKPCLIIYGITFAAYSLLTNVPITEENIRNDHLNPFIIDISQHNYSLKLLADWFLIKMDWYVYTTLVMYAFFWLSTYIYEGTDDASKRRRICFLIDITAVYYLICSPIYTHNMAHYYRNLWAFVLGVIIAYKPMILNEHKLGGEILLVLLTAFNWFREGHLYAGAALLAVLFLLFLGYTNRRHDIDNRFLLFLGGISYFLYLCHRMFYGLLWATDMLYFPLFVTLSIGFAIVYKKISDSSRRKIS